MQPDRSDANIRTFILASRARSYPDIAAAITAKFGAARSWPMEWIKAVVFEPGTPAKGSYERDSEVISFIDDRAGLVALDGLLALGVARFGVDRFPSRSQLHRLVAKVRERALRAAGDS